MIGFKERRETMTVLPRRWTDMPGTPWQVMLRGKMHERDGVMIERGGGPVVVGGWDSRPVFGLSFVRRRPGGDDG